MTITPEQRERRRDSVGASDVPAILGMSPFGDPLSVYLSKVEGIDPEFDEGQTDAITWGNLAEPALLDWAEYKLGVTIDRDVEVIQEDGFMACNLDGWFQDSEDHSRCYGVEAKTSSFTRDWGDVDDEVPPHVTLQCQAQCYVANLQGVHVVADIHKFGRVIPSMFYIPRDDRIIEKMLPELTTFWFQHVMAGVAPEPTAKALQVLKQRPRQEGLRAPVRPKVVSALDAVKNRLKQLEATKKALEAELLFDLDKAEIGEYSDYEVTYFEQSRKSYSKKGDNPCPECGVGLKTSTFRVLRKRKKPAEIEGPK